MTFDNLNDAFTWLEEFTNYEKHPPSTVEEYSLDRMNLMLGAFGNPQNSFKSVHIAGSKGKGSTAAFTAAVLSEAGFRTGLYTSPHVTTYRERIKADGREFDDADYLVSINHIADRLGNDAALAPAMEGAGPTTFELLTLLGFLMFREAGCAWAVIETGLGGRLDATNTVLPEIAVITPVELEHTDILGKSLEKIAREKAGIMKAGRPACIGHQKPESEAVLVQRGAELGIPVSFLARETASISSRSEGAGTAADIRFHSYPPIRTPLGMLGDFQAENAALAALSLYLLFPDSMNGIPTGERICRGLSLARLPGRMELVSKDPVIILDGAHTPVSADRLSRAFVSMYGGEGVLLFGCVSDKDAGAMANILAGCFRHIVISTPGTYKKSVPEQVFEIYRKLKPDTRFEPDPAQALSAALALAGGRLPVLVAGSFYMAAEIRKLLVS